MTILFTKEVVGTSDVIRVSVEGSGSAVLLETEVVGVADWLNSRTPGQLLIASHEDGKVIPPTVIQAWRLSERPSSQTPPNPVSKESAFDKPESPSPDAPPEEVPQSSPAHFQS